MEADISQLEAPTFTTLNRGPPEPMLRLRWDHKVSLIGEKVLNPMIHCCDKCLKPILIYGRMAHINHRHSMGDDSVGGKVSSMVSQPPHRKIPQATTQNDPRPSVPPSPVPAPSPSAYSPGGGYGAVAPPPGAYNPPAPAPYYPPVASPYQAPHGQVAHQTVAPPVPPAQHGAYSDPQAQYWPPHPPPPPIHNYFR
ncbi:unnamed protein product [Nesidiocoris tenuis]|nr:unnamed protein product [Nesidiocoris tenuis]